MVFASIVTAMTCEVWLRNPDNYIREVIEVGESNLVWDFGVLKKKSIDPHKLCMLYYGEQLPWRAIIVKSPIAYMIDAEHTEDNPVATWPVWEYGQSWESLLKLIDNPAEGQEHRIIITGIPSVAEGPGRLFVRQLSELQEEHPEVILHVHALYSFRVLFGLEFKSVDFDARTHAAKDTVVLPSGKRVSQASSTQQPHWVNLMGMRPVDLKVPRNRCMFNIKSAVWAGEHYKEAIKFRTRGFTHIDPDDPFKRSPRSQSIMVKRVKASPGDKWLCDTCNLQLACKFFRSGGVCIVPESEPVELARFFKTRDADTIIDGLGTLLATQTRRLEDALQSEHDKQELHPETTKIINTLFDRGVKLAKLLDPALAAAGAPKVTTNNLTQINAANPQELMAAIVQEFVNRGIPRESITPDMVLSIMEKPEDIRARAIEVASSEAS